MARPLRIEYEGAWYHVMNRGAGRRDVYRNDTHRVAFLNLLGEITTTFGVECHAYCLMGNHYHLLMHSPEGNLGRTMRHLNGVYSQRFNRLQKSDDALFREHYKAVLVDADRYLLAVSRYIHLNSVAGGLVDKPQAYRWSSYRAYVEEAPPEPWLHTQTTLGMLGRRVVRRRYRAFVEQGVDDEIAEFFGGGRQAPALGDEAFREGVAHGLSDVSELAEAKRLRCVPAIKEIVAAVAVEFGADTETIYRTSRG